MAKVAEWQARDIARLLKAGLPRLLDLPARKMWLDYDSDADVLYLSFAKPQRATDSELREDGIIMHRRGKKVVGVTVQDASTR